jgi:Zn-dependent M28 family amino/carboxypeptidase
MRPSFRHAVPALVLAAALLVACASSPAPVAAPVAAAHLDDSPWARDVVALAAAHDNAARRAHLAHRLGGLGLAVTREPFDVGSLHGENLFADVGGPAEAPLLLIGAHSDRVDVSRGATDNASGSAVVLALAERFRQRPLAHHRVRIALWDLEEHGLLGAEAHVEAAGSERPALYVNVDVFGWGDTLWMMTPAADAPLVAVSRDAATAHGLLMTASARYPPSDHRAFLKAGWPAVSYALADHDEIPAVVAVFSGKRSMTRPKMLRVIHTADDTVAQIDAVAAAKGVDTIEAALRAWDAAGD